MWRNLSRIMREKLQFSNNYSYSIISIIYEYLRNAVTCGEEQSFSAMERRAIITNNSSAVARAFKCFCNVTIHRDMGPPMELRQHRANVSGECKLMRALRDENAVTPIVSLSTHPRALPVALPLFLLLLTSILR